jgi:hypothetical protein
MTCSSCGFAAVTLGQSCPRCGRVAVLASEASPAEQLPAYGPPATVEPTVALTAPSGQAEPTVAFPPGAQVPPVAVAEAAPKRRKTAVVALVAALVVALVGGGVAFAGFRFGWFGEGKQPYGALPASSIAYYQVDLDPAADQRLAALSFFRELPQLKGAASNASFDLKEQLWTEWAKSNDTHGLNYAADIKPWLGDRAGVAALPVSSSQSTSTPVVALQVTDEKLAAEKLPILLSTDASVVTISDGYALITTPSNVEQVKTALAAGTLDKNQTFSADLATLGSTGWAAGWVDLKALADVAQGGSSSTLEVQGRATFALRFSGGALELAGGVLGLDSSAIPTITGGTDLGDLPADTGFALSVQGGGALVKANWDEISSGLNNAGVLTPADWVLPDDLVSILGTQFTAALPRTTIGKALDSDFWQSGAYASAAVGIKITTDKPQRVQELISGMDPTAIIKVRADADTVAIATTDEYLAQLADNTGAKLSASSVFTSAIPDHSASALSLYFDAASLGSDWTSKLPTESSDYAAFLKALSSVGFSAVPNSSGLSWSLRVVRA